MNLKACLIAFAILLPGVASANDTPTTVTPKADTEKPTTMAKLSSDEIKVISHIKHVNDTEVAMGKLAQSKGSAEVKKYGTTLVKDHTDNNTKLVALAKKNGLAKIPAEMPMTDDDKAAAKTMDADMAKLKTLKGAEFDKQLLTMAVAGHDKTLAALTAAEATVTNADLKDHIKATMPVVQTHADTARDLATKATTTSMK
ncbi:MAG TPA: DUF4142 domain-containing protein [Kofleriaceae bacterium]|jgi:putative membrane protein